MPYLPRHLLLFLAVICAVFLLACEQKDIRQHETEKVVLATSGSPFSGMIFLAQHEGFFQREGLDLTLVSTNSSKEALALMLEGKADFSAAASIQFASAILGGAKPRLLATVSKSDSANALVARRDRGITNVQDLVGKRVGVAFRTSAHYYLHSLLIEAGIPAKSVRIINMSPPESTRAIADGTLDATVQYLPWDIRSAHAVGPDAFVFAPQLYITHWIIATNRDVMQKRPEIASRFLRALQDAEKLAVEHPGRAIAVTAKTIGLSQEEMAKRQREYKDHIHLPQSMLISLENEARWYAILHSRDGKIAPIPNFLHDIDSTPLKHVKPGAARIIE